MTTDQNQNRESCTYKEGTLPSCAPLAASFVPKQTSAEPRYAAEKGLERGTLFPGLDLPLCNIVNTGTADVPEAELMALDFAAHDVSLYLDTHPDDKEAFAVYKELLALAAEGRRTYEERYGPVMVTAQGNCSSYVWAKRPFPWTQEG